MARLRPCRSCARRVRITVATCPSCDRNVDTIAAARSLGRAWAAASAGMILFGMAVVACVGGPGEPTTISGPSTSGTSSPALGSVEPWGTSTPDDSGASEPPADAGASD